MAMHLNDDLLLRFGYWVPSNFTSLGSYDFKHLAISSQTIEGNLSPIFYAAEEHDSDKVDSMLNFIFNTKNNNILLSSELVFYYPDDFLYRVVNVAQMHGFEVHLIAYLERQDRALIKGYLQNIRNHRFHGTIVDFVAATRRMRYFEYHTILTRIKEICHMAKLSIRTFDREFLKDNDILSDFINTVNPVILRSNLVRPAGRVNASLRLEEIEIVRALNVLNRRDLVELFTENESDLSFAERNRLRSYYYREEIRQIILNDIAPSNGALLADFFPDATEGLRRYWQTIPEIGPEEKLDPNALANCLISLLRAAPMKVDNHEHDST